VSDALSEEHVVTDQAPVRSSILTEPARQAPLSFVWPRSRAACR